MSVLSDERIDNIVRRTNIAADKSGRVTTAFIMDRIREIREKGFCYSQDVPFLGGATLSMLLPVKIHNQAAAMFEKVACDDGTCIWLPLTPRPCSRARIP